MPQKDPHGPPQDRDIYRLLIDSVQDYAIILLGPDGTVQSWNKGAEMTIGYSASVIIGQSFEVLYSPADRDRGLPGLSLTKAVEKGHTQDIGWRVRKDGSQFWADVTISALYDSGHTLLGFSKVVRDISIQKHAEDELKRIKEAEAGIRKYELLEARNKEMEQFTFIASHDLLEPIQTVSSFVELLSEEYHDTLDENAQKYIGYISDATRRMMELVRGLLHYSRLGRGAELKLMDCSTLAREVLDDLALEIAEVRAGIHIGPLPTLPVYPAELKELFHDLVSNAIKFRKPDVPLRIDITAEQADGIWTFAVADNGIGIADRYKEKIFIIFQRLNDRHEYSGTGIGLAYSKKIVDLHNGDIWVASTPGIGSTFYFTIKT